MRFATTIVILVSAGLATLVISANLALAQSCPPQITDPQPLNTDAAFDFTADAWPSVATDGAGRWLALWVSGGDFSLARSSDDGASWTDSVMHKAGDIPSLGVPSSPQLATDGTGNWLAVWGSRGFEGGPFGDDADIFYSRSTNNGDSWTEPSPLNSGASLDTRSDSRPQIATDRRGHWVAVWTSRDLLGGPFGYDADVFFSRSTDNGISWSDEQPLNTNAVADIGADAFPHITTNRSGKWIAVWHSSNDLGGPIGTDHDILFANTTDDGLSWTDPRPLNMNATYDSGNDQCAQVAWNGAGQWLVVWFSPDDLGGTIGTDSDVLFSRSMDNGVSWSLPAPVDPNAAFDSGPDARSHLAGDGAGTSVAAWWSRGFRGGAFGDDVDLLFSLTTDNGASWTSPTPLNTNAALDDDSDVLPRLAGNGAGNWVGVWQSSDDLKGTIGNDLDILFARFQLFVDRRETICHVPPGNSRNARTIVVDENAVLAHLAHGDHCGPCEEEGCPPLTPPVTPGGQIDWYVDDGNCPSPGSGKKSNPFCKIQDAIDAAGDGELVLVYPGRYFEAIDFLGKAITVQSLEPMNPDVVECTVIDGSRPEPSGYGAIVNFVNGESLDSALRGFTISNGIMAGYRTGIICAYASSPFIADCVITNNRAETGGGIACSSSSPMITNCTVSQNSSLTGGGLLIWNNSSPVISNCLILDNFASLRGGGILASGNPTFDHCTVAGNTAAGQGGGMYNYSGLSVAISNCLFQGNAAEWGGGMYNDRAESVTLSKSTFMHNLATNGSGGGILNDETDIIVTNCIFQNNAAANFAGGVQEGVVWSGPRALLGAEPERRTANVTFGWGGGLSVLSANARVTNSLFSENSAARGAGLFGGFGGNLILANCTFSGNSADTVGGGLYVVSESDATVNNSIFWNNMALQGPEMFIDSALAVLTVSYSDVDGGQEAIGASGMVIWGVGNIDADPLFADPSAADFRLLAGSPCIDAGDNTSVAADIVTDLDGNPRFVDNPDTPDTGNPDGIRAIVDIGTFEFGISGCPDEDGDGRVTLCHNSAQNPGSARTIMVTNNAVAAHLAHGDHCGPCE